MKLKLLFCVNFLFFNLLAYNAFGQVRVVFSKPDTIINISKYIEYLEDPRHILTIDQVSKSTKFQKSKLEVANLGLTTSNFWVRICIQNETSDSILTFELAEPSLDLVEFYQTNYSHLYYPTIISQSRKFKDRKYSDPNFLFDVILSKHQFKTFYFKIASNKQIQLPLFIGNQIQTTNLSKNRDFLVGVYIGIMLIMIFYNLFLYFSVKDKIYLYHVTYISFILLVQASVLGYTFKWLWPASPWMALHSMFLFPIFVGMAFIEFSKVFLSMRINMPKLWMGTFLVQFSYTIALVADLSGHPLFSYKLIEITAGFISFYMLLSASIIVPKYRPAKFYLLAWSVFLVGVIIFVLKDFEILPYNNITVHTMQVGSALESLLLSFALADRINILKREKEDILKAQTETLKIKVAEATMELNTKNRELDIAYKDLQDAQADLLQQEKMVSLGNMAAGIAHEINNPIHIANQSLDIIETSKKLYLVYINQLESIEHTNKPIKEQFDKLKAYKTEIEFDEIDEDINKAIARARNGIDRAENITKELKNLSKIDNVGWVLTDINRDLQSILELLGSLADSIQIVSLLGNIPMIVCNAQKFNELYQNVFINAIEAVKEKKEVNFMGRIEIRTFVFLQSIIISFEDNGVGMSSETLKSAFNPFFTTKGAQRKGLGLANVYRTLAHHNGKVELNSKLGIGTKLELIIPIHDAKKV